MPKHDYEFLKKQFFDPEPKYRLSVFFDAKQTDAASDAAGFVNSCERSDIGSIIPRISEDRKLDPGELEHFRNTYRAMLETAKAQGLEIVFNIEGAIEDSIISSAYENYGETSTRSKILVKYEYTCFEDEKVKLRLREGKLMSVVAVGDNDSEITDLREFVKDGVLEWQTPRGNWIIEQFYCVDDFDRNYSNVLSYDAAMSTLGAAWSLFADIFEPYMPDVLTGIAYSDICFPSYNRRDWDPGFNEVFIKRYGFDPAPYYPALFATEMKNAEHYKALFFDCRARMLADGAVKALKDFADAKGLRIMGTTAEPKLSACSFVSGDPVLCGRYAPGAILEKAYMYGVNSLKIAAASSCNFGEDRVTCDLFRNYYKISKRIMYNEVFNAYSRGANHMVAHLPVLSEEKDEPEPFVKSEKAPDWQSEFACFISRTQVMLRGGQHIADIGLLYPIYALHSKVNFYSAPVKDGFEYPDTPDNSDYMTLINSIMMYAGHDLSIIHPDALGERSRVENGKLVITAGDKTENLSVMVLPCSETVSVVSMRKLLEFYRSGGKLIATGELPSYAFEFDPSGELDREVRNIGKEIFGPDAADTDIMKEFCYNKNDAGGEAYFLYFSRTAADGTNMTSSRKVNDAICSFKIPYDMYLPDMPRFQITGSLNMPYFEFVRLGLIYSIPGGGMLNHVHKRHGTTDVFYFSNTTERNYSNYVLLRGAISPERWDPHDITVTKMPCTYVRWRGEIYTRVELNLKHAASVFVISDTKINPPQIPENVTELE